MDRDEASDLEFRDYVNILSRRRRVIGLAVVAVLVAAVGASLLQTRVYQATARVLLQPNSTDSLFNTVAGQVPTPATDTATQIEVITSQPIRDAVKARLGAAPAVSAAQVGQTSVIAISADSTIPGQAATIANAYAQSYIDSRRTRTIDELLAAAQQIQAKISDLQTQINKVVAQIDSAPDTQRAATESALGPQRDALIAQQEVFKGRLYETQVSSALQSGGAELVNPATTPTSPTRPRPLRTAILAVVVGAIAGVGFALLLEFVDDSIRTKEDLERAVRGSLPTLAVIPALPTWKETWDTQVVSVAEPMSPAAEAYRTLRTAIQFLGIGRAVRVIQVTSPSAGEGKTTTIANLGAALAGTGKRVVVSCCDLRRPRIHEFFGLSNEVGLTSVLLGKVPLDQAVQAAPGVPGLYVLASGPPPPNPSELLGSAGAAALFESISRKADFVLIDCPPVLLVTDAAVISARVDATLLVASSASTSRRAIVRALELLRQVDAPVVGAVLNGALEDDSLTYGYGRERYGRYYGTDAGGRTSAGAPRVATERAPSGPGRSAWQELLGARGRGRAAR